MYIGIPFGEIDGVMVHISDVSSGLDCKCVCANCKMPLVAKKGNEKTHHFAHYSTKECNIALETSIHKACKQILINEKLIAIPPFPDIDIFNKVKTIQLSHVDIEKSFQTSNGIIKVDAHGIMNNNKSIILEIAVTHKSDAVKIEKIKELKLPTLEIYVDQKLNTFEEIKKFLIESDTSRIWLYHPLMENQDILEYIENFKIEIKNELEHYKNCLHQNNIIKFEKLKKEYEELKIDLKKNYIRKYNNELLSIKGDTFYLRQRLQSIGATWNSSKREWILPLSLKDELFNIFIENHGIQVSEIK